MSVWCCSDIHGYHDIYEQIKEFINKEDIVYFLGDSTDRGPYSLETFFDIINDPQFIYIRGNHDNMMLEYIENDCRNPTLLLANGGQNTVDSLNKFSQEDLGKIIRRLIALPYYKTYTNKKEQLIFLSHAGFSPILTEDKEYIEIPYEEDLIWDRNHFNDDYKLMAPNVISVGGHTYVQSFSEPPNRPYWYAFCRKVDIDMGIFLSGNCLLLNLDDFSYELFKTKEKILLF